MIEIIENNINAPLGFKSIGVHAGIRKKKLDVAIIYSEKPAIAAAVTTKNKIKAAPVIVTKRHLKKQALLQAIVINSGNANACTGKLGLEHALMMTNQTASALNIRNPSHVAVASTGVIGVTLPIDKITSAICLAAETIHNSTHHLSAAEAIMTTDTTVKEIAVKMVLSGKTVRIGGIAKGSGMIHPNMATMLGFITTDAAISEEMCQYALKNITENTFNMVSVDVDTSTNDMVILLANGMAGNPKINSTLHPDFELFYQGLLQVCTHLTKEIARDGEGASKLMEIQVSGAVNQQQAKKAARAICSSSLVKTAIYGADANWGRIACAVGYSGANFCQERLSIMLGSHILFENGVPLCFDNAVLTEALQAKTIAIKVDLGMSNAKATAWGCDLTHDYISINASYRS